MRKPFSEEQIIGFLREAEAGIVIKDLCRQQDFSEASHYPAQQVRRHERALRQAAQGPGCGEHSPEDATGTTGLRERRDNGCVAKK